MMNIRKAAWGHYKNLCAFHSFKARYFADVKTHLPRC